jgi:hypothetical protein
MILKNILLIVIFALGSVFPQDKDSYNSSDSSGHKGGLIDLSKLSVHHSLNFGMGTSIGSPLQSQSVYNTMLTYQFSQPVTLNLNFGLPIYSTFSSAQNLTSKNISSAEYFKSMPIDVSLSWKPLNNLFFQLNVVRNPQWDMFSGPYSPFYYTPYPMHAEQSTNAAK